MISARSVTQRRQCEEEAAKLNKLVADLNLDKLMLQDMPMKD